MDNIDKFKDFIKKYKKTRYISKDSSKKLKSIGLESFKNIESKIEKWFPILIIKDVKIGSQKLD